jgi:hypothetical protein
MINETIIGYEQDIKRLIDIIPKNLKDYIESSGQINELVEIVMDIGQVPLVRYEEAHLRIESLPEVTFDDIDSITQKIAAFNSDNRAGIEQTLHRISAIRNRTGRVVGLSLRVGRAVIGSIALIEDLIKDGKSV